MLESTAAAAISMIQWAMSHSANYAVQSIYLQSNHTSDEFYIGMLLPPPEALLLKLSNSLTTSRFSGGASSIAQCRIRLLKKRQIFQTPNQLRVNFSSVPLSAATVEFCSYGCNLHLPMPPHERSNNVVWCLSMPYYERYSWSLSFTVKSSQVQSVIANSLDRER